MRSRIGLAFGVYFGKIGNATMSPGSILRVITGMVENVVGLVFRMFQTGFLGVLSCTDEGPVGTFR